MASVRAAAVMEETPNLAYRRRSQFPQQGASEFPCRKRDTPPHLTPLHALATRRRRSHQLHSSDEGVHTAEAIRTSHQVLDLRYAPRRETAQPSLHHGKYREPLTPCEVDWKERRHLDAASMGMHGAIQAHVRHYWQVHRPRARWGIHLSIGYEYKGWLILDLQTSKIAPARDVMFYERLTLARYHADEQAGAARVYAHGGMSFTSPEDQAVAAVPDCDAHDEHPGVTPRSCNDDDDDDDSAPGPPRRQKPRAEFPACT
ncbi:unnamed protein product [Closterium sp. NIES-54]